MLALVGSGEYLPGMEPVDRELLRRLGAGVRVACLPTGAGQEGADRIAYWSQLGVDHFTHLGARAEAVPVIDRAGAHNADLAHAIAAADFVYFSGGRPDYLYRTLVGSPAWQAVQSVVARGGLLAGCSAGAMIQGEKILGLPFLGAGFNLVPGVVVMPHYAEISARVRSLIRLRVGPALTLLGVEGDTALVVTGPQAEVLGSGGVTIWGRSAPTRYTQGPLPWPPGSPARSSAPRD
jgi:cyanophycinase-like exopeptidase